MKQHPARIIARLDIKGRNVVKGVQMEGLRIVGKPNILAQKYYEQGADELIFMDIVASLYGRNQILPVIENAAKDIFIPITVGGGLRSIEDITTVLRSGADKVAINTAAIADPKILSRASEVFGSQCIVLSIEAKVQSDGHWECYTDNGRERTGRNAVDWAEEAEALGVGEILVTSVDRDGTRSGLDIGLCRAIRQCVRIPVIAAGGAGESRHISELFRQTSIDAVCCGLVFHFDACPIPMLKKTLDEDGHGVRL